LGKYPPNASNKILIELFSLKTIFENHVITLYSIAKISGASFFIWKQRKNEFRWKSLHSEKIIKLMNLHTYDMFLRKRSSTCSMEQSPFWFPSSVRLDDIACGRER